MGQQQLLLIILGVIVVGIAIAVGISMFSSGSVQSNKDAIINDMNNLAANAYQHRIRPSSMGGGAGAYDNSKGGNTWVVPAKLDTTENGFYIATVGGPDAVTLTATSASYTTSTVTATIDINGKLTSWTYTGDFQ
jgi:hypothetical protein